MGEGRGSRLLRRLREVGASGVVRRLAEPAIALGRERRVRDFERAFVDRETQGAALGGSLRDATAADLRRILDPKRFFFDATRADLREAFLCRHPKAAEQIREQAAATLRGDLSWVIPGGVGDWHAALPWGGRWPQGPSAGVGIGDEKPLGDVRLSWETGRCTHLVRLAQWGWLDRDVSVGRAAVDGILDWIEENPIGIGIGWAHAQEAALRAVAWLWVLHLVSAIDAGHRPEALRRILESLLAHGEFVVAHRSDSVITHNHLISEASGLVLLGTALGGLPEAARWRSVGCRTLWRQVVKQVGDDGVQAEHSTHYHAFVMDSIAAALVLSRHCGRKVPTAVVLRFAQMAEFVAALVRHDGTLPAMGDTDAGRAWRLGTDPLDRRDVLAVAAVALDRPCWGRVAGDAAGAFWICEGAIVPGAELGPPAGGARRWSAAGIAMARTGYAPDEEIIVFRAGATRFRRDVHQSHAHADALSVLWRWGGRDVLLDPGVYLYSEGEGHRPRMRGTAAHNTVLVDRRDQADVSSRRFGVYGLRAARWLAFAGAADSLTTAAEHPAGGLPRVRRTLRWSPGVLVIFDEILGSGEHEIAVHFHTAAARRVGEAEGLRLRIDGAIDLSFRTSESGATLRASGSEEGSPVFWSPRYGTLVPATRVEIVAGRRPLPYSIATAIEILSSDAEPGPFLVDRDGPSIRVAVAGVELRSLRLAASAAGVEA